MSLLFFVFFVCQLFCRLKIPGCVVLSLFQKDIRCRFGCGFISKETCFPNSLCLSMSKNWNELTILCVLGNMLWQETFTESRARNSAGTGWEKPTYWNYYTSFVADLPHLVRKPHHIITPFFHIMTLKPDEFTHSHVSGNDRTWKCIVEKF